MLMGTTNKVAVKAKHMCRILDKERKAVWSVLRGSFSQQLDYHCLLAYPSDIRDASRFLDVELWSMLDRSTRFHILRGEEGSGCECCPQRPVPGLSSRSYKNHLVCWPIKRGGFGLRSMEETCAPAFVGC